MNKKYLWGAVAAIILVVFSALAYSTRPNFSPTPIEKIKENPDSFGGKTVMIEGRNIVLSSIDTDDGRVAFYAIKDDTGQIPVEMNTVGWDLKGEKIGIAGILGQVCVHAKHEADSWACDKNETGMIS